MCCRSKYATAGPRREQPHKAEAWRGRLLGTRDDLTTGAHPVAVLSYGAWQRRFGADPQVVGSAVRINGHPFMIVGIAPPGFIGTERFFAAEIWIPFSMIREIEGRDRREWRNTHNAWSVARLKPGLSRSRAEASLELLASQMAVEQPEVNESDIPTDWRVMVFAVSTSLLSALASSLLPSLSSSGVDPAPALKNETPLGRLRRFHFRDVFVAVQVAVSIVLLTGAVMMVRTL